MSLILPPFDSESSRESVKSAQDLWNKNDIKSIISGYSSDGFYMRYRGIEITNRKDLEAALILKWNKELNYTIEKKLLLFSNDKITVQFIYEWTDSNNQDTFYRTFGNEFWIVNNLGEIIYHTISSNELLIQKEDLRLIKL
ncbi:MAG: DUF1348 family protein [Crocinitomicaceae bacterium]